VADIAGARRTVTYERGADGNVGVSIRTNVWVEAANTTLQGTVRLQRSANLARGIRRRVPGRPVLAGSLC
jgi:hypothetical protein